MDDDVEPPVEREPKKIAADYLHELLLRDSAAPFATLENTVGTARVVAAPSPQVIVPIQTPDYATAPLTGVDSPSFSFSSVSSTSVVSASAIALAAFCKAVLATLAGSMMPSLNMSPYSPLAAL